MSIECRIRLADYFIVIELDESQLNRGCNTGSVTQRFPEEDWPEVPFSPNLNIFCCPQGWSLSSGVQAPSFFFSTLTDLSGCHQYACCLRVLEPCSSAAGYVSDDVRGHSSTGAVLYKPKVYVILSRFAYFDLFRSCLNRIFEALIDNDVNAADSMVASLVSSVYLTSTPKNVFFTLLKEKFCVKPLVWQSVPITGNKIATLASQLGTVHNLLLVMCCLLRDQKLILVSSSMSRLSDAGYALKSLLYPFEYSYSLVSVLPEMAIECLESPAPYIMGVHTSNRERIPEVEACIVNLDIGSVEDPLKTTLDVVPEPFLTRLVVSLQAMLNPGLATADNAFQTGNPPPLSDDHLDKRIRACFLRFFSELLYGYRSCLQLVRLHDNPLIVFHKAAYLGMRDLYDSEMLHSLLNSLMFQSFVADRGLPFRSVDLFDEVVAHLNLKDEIDDYGKGPLMEEIILIARKLEENERQEVAPLTTVPLSRKRSLSTTSRFLPSHIPALNSNAVTTSIVLNLAESPGVSTKVACMAPIFNTTPKVVPVSSTASLLEEQLGGTARRLKVLTDCLRHIFESRLSEALKLLSAVELSMRSSYSRVALCQLLWDNLQPVNRATLEPRQFDLLCRLINCALENESSDDEHGIAYALLYLSNVYCRRLNAGVLQFLYTCVQDHAVWENQRFWETAFFHDVHQQMRRFYASKSGKHSREQNGSFDCPYSLKNISGTWNLFDEPSAMEIAADRLERIHEMSPEEVKQLSAEEQAILFGQAKHYINLMVYLRVPLDASRLRRVNVKNLERGGGREAGSEFDDSDVESGYVENSSDDTDLGSSTVKWISKLIDRICSAAGLPHKQIEQIISEIPGFVGVHIDNLEQVHFESQRISPLHKPKIVQPVLHQSEKLLIVGLRAFLLPDGRNQTVSGSVDQQTMMLPAEGALFLTNYRLVFKGQPCNPFLSDTAVVRSMPIMSVIKDKQINEQLAQNEALSAGIPLKTTHRLHDALQIRSSAFQLMKVAFDEEVSSEEVDYFMRTLNDLRWPESQPRTYFAFAPVADALYFGASVTPGKGKYSTFRDLKRTFVRNPLKLASDKKKTAPPFAGYKNVYHTSSGSSLPTAKSTTERPSTILEDSMDKTATIAKLHSNEYIDLNNCLYDAKHLKHIAQVSAEKHYLLDYQRLGLLSENTSRFRISHINDAYEICRSYPSVLVVPATVSDEHFVKIAKGFKMGRFPVIVWQNANGAFLARGSGLNGKNVVAKIKKQANFLGSVGTALEAENALSGHGGSRISLSSADGFLHAGATGSSADLQARYMCTLTNLSPPSQGLTSTSLYGSLTSLFSEDTLLTTDGVSVVSSSTPDMSKRSNQNASDMARHAATFVRNSGGKTFSSRNFTSSVASSTTKTTKSSGVSVRGSVHRVSSSILNLTRNSLYIFGDKSRSKSIKLEKQCEFIPISYPTAHNVKSSFKKLMRVAIPSWNTPVDGSIPYGKMLDDSGWMQMVSQLLSVSNSIVNLIDLHRSSVALCIEDGWDSTCQLSSLAQILLDPFYRTIEGFRLLVEKEWLAFGFRFMHRGNHTVNSQASGAAPMFIMFLDAVYQIRSQYPNAFEFSDFYIRFLAFHSISCHFATFLFDTEMERIHFSEAFSVYSQAHVPPQSLFTYIEEKLRDSPIPFYNCNYVPAIHSVIRPEVGIAALHLWEWYTEDHLAHGSCYDLDLSEKEFGQREQENFENVDSRASVQVKRPVRVLDNTYQCTDLMETNAFAVPLQNLGRLREIADDKKESSNVQGWKEIMDEASKAVAESEELKTHEANEWNSRVHRAVHKKDTVRLLLRGTSHQLSYSRLRESNLQNRNGHSFDLYSGTPSLCDLCNQSIQAATRSHKCVGCGLLAHEKCRSHITWLCSGKEKSGSTENENTPCTNSVNHDLDTGTLSDKEYTLTPPSSTSTSYIHSGFLNKKGVTFRLWKPRWFVLDANRHEFRYYDSKNDSSCKGVIDLSEVKNVEIKRNIGATANMFELRTTKRTYTLMAYSRSEAEEWVEKIETVLRE
ncbi:hypothetical protein L596_003909 [Steinernema carpocapsae]|uniref:Myotubularin-related protein 13 n=1 Tax=Steinernema carpocapsae TaxID=34508 RepID=A0A4U8UU67_STECR|nr:hypothetical protein L596_003909 [Steinernema carpocapsae]